MILKRFFDEKAFKVLKNDLDFLVEFVKKPNTPFTLSLGNNNCALFCYGISMCRIELSLFGGFEMMIPKVFFLDELENNSTFNFRKSAQGFFAELNKELMAQLISDHYLDQFASKIVSHLDKPEVKFAHNVKQANQDSKNFILIDHLVTDGELKGKRMDTLALQREGDQYALRVVDCRLADNVDLQESIPRQLSFFASNISRHINDYQENYQNNYKQKYDLGLFPSDFPDNIQINRNVKGMIVLPYGSDAPSTLNKIFPELIVTHVNAQSRIE